MDLLEIKYHLKRLFNMARYKGLKCAFDYFLVQSLYNSDFVYEKIIYPLFPKSVFYPPFIEVEVTTKCMLRCVMCEHTYWKEKNQEMTFEQLKSIVEQFPKLKWIGLTGIGESFLNPDFLEMIRYVKSRGIILELTDNFYLIDEKISRVLIETGVERMVVSLDAATEKTYRKIRVGSDFNRVIRNIKTLRKLKKRMNSYYPEISFHYIISKYNLGEILLFIDLVKKIMDKEDTSIFFTSILHPFPEIKDLVVDVPEEIMRQAKEKSRKLGIKIGWNKNVPKEKDPITRCNEWTEPFIFVDGTVIPCCAGNEVNKRSYQKRTSMGNIFKTPFKEIWNGPKYRTLRKMIHEGKTPPACKYCTIYKVR